MLSFEETGNLLHDKLLSYIKQLFLKTYTLFFNGIAYMMITLHAKRLVVNRIAIDYCVLR